MKEAMLYKKLNNNQVECRVCNHFCKINDGKRGICGVRENREGVLYALNYGLACAENVDPIEKKPLYHFLPGTFSLSVATVGCNFRCDNCQNWEISQNQKSNIKNQISKIKIIEKDLSPENIVKDAVERGCPSISYTYTEPTVFVEYALETMKLARAAGLKNVWVSNGYMSPEALELILPYLDAINVDLKSFSARGGSALGGDDNFYKRHCGARLQPVLDNLAKIKKSKVHLEITTLIIPGLSDDLAMLKKLAEFIGNELGKDVPWHVSRFSGAISWKLQDLPDTPLETVMKAKEIGEEAGLRWVHVGNV